MLTTVQATEIIRHLSVLPPAKILEVKNFILALKEPHARDLAIDESEVWTDEDIRDLMAATLQHAEQKL